MRLARWSPGTLARPRAPLVSSGRGRPTALGLAALGLTALALTMAGLGGCGGAPSPSSGPPSPSPPPAGPAPSQPEPTRLTRPTERPRPTEPTEPTEPAAPPRSFVLGPSSDETSLELGAEPRHSLSAPVVAEARSGVEHASLRARLEPHELRLVVRLRGAPRAVRVHVGFAHPEPPELAPASDCEPAPHERGLDRAACRRFEARLAAYAASFEGRFRRAFEVSPDGVSSGGRPVEGARVVAHELDGAQVLHATLPTEALPEACEAPIRRMMLALELPSASPASVGPAPLYEMTVRPFVRLGSEPGLLEVVVGRDGHRRRLCYQPGSAVHTATRLERSPSFTFTPWLEQSVDLTPLPVATLGDVTVAFAQLAPGEHSLVGLTEGEVMWQSPLEGRVLASGPRDGGFAVVLHERGAHYHHFIHTPFVTLRGLWVDPQGNAPRLTEAQALCEGALLPGASLLGAAARLTCTSGGGDSDEPLRTLAPSLLRLRWNGADGYEERR